MVDYKTGRAEVERLESDRDQILPYYDAIESMTGRTCRGLLWYIDEDRDEIVEVSVRAGCCDCKRDYG